MRPCNSFNSEPSLSLLKKVKSKNVCVVCVLACSQRFSKSFLIRFDILLIGIQGDWDNLDRVKIDYTASLLLFDFTVFFWCDCFHKQFKRFSCINVLK